MIKKILRTFKKRMNCGIEAYLSTIYSFQQNQFLKDNGINFADLPLWKLVNEIHSIMPLFDYSSTFSLRRVGREYDGGYIMLFPFSSDKIAYSIGICDDVSWDLDMVKEGYKVFQYDHTIKRLPLNNDNFFFKKIGISSSDSTNLKTLNTMINENKHCSNNGMVLKMDVEGCEWDVLNNLTNELEKFDQIVIELHNLLDINKKEIIINGLKKLTEHHRLVHIHYNNYGKIVYVGDYVAADSIEVTLIKSNKCLNTSNRLLPVSLDKPCNPGMDDIYIGKWNCNNNKSSQ